MELLFLWIGNFGTKTASFLFGKKVSNMLRGKGLLENALYWLITGCGGCIFFALSSGLNIKINSIVVLYSLLYAFIVMLSLLYNIFAYRLVKISNLNIISNSGSLIVQFVLGFFLFHEALKISGFVRLILMLVALSFVFLGTNKEKSQKSNSKNSILFCLITLVSIVISTGELLILKYYSLTSVENDVNSLFFLTNVFLVLFALICLIIGNKSNYTENNTQISFKSVFVFLCSVFLGNIGSIICATLVAKVDMSLYSPLNSGIGIIGGSVASLISKEKLKSFYIFAALIAFVAILI